MPLPPPTRRPRSALDREPPCRPLDHDRDEAAARRRYPTGDRAAADGHPNAVGRRAGARYSLRARGCFGWRLPGRAVAGCGLAAGDASGDPDCVNSGAARFVCDPAESFPTADAAADVRPAAAADAAAADAATAAVRRHRPLWAGRDGLATAALRGSKGDPREEEDVAL